MITPEELIRLESIGVTYVVIMAASAEDRLVLERLPRLERLTLIIQGPINV